MHTPEPWSFRQDPTELRLQGVTARNEYERGECADVWVTRETTSDDARRICACVNACAGVPTEVLEALAPSEGENRERYHWTPRINLDRLQQDQASGKGCVTCFVCGGRAALCYFCCGRGYSILLPTTSAQDYYESYPGLPRLDDVVEAAKKTKAP